MDYKIAERKTKGILKYGFTIEDILTLNAIKYNKDYLLKEKKLL